FGDVDPITWTLDPADLERKITRRTRAVMPVHIYGHPADMGPIRRIARTHGLSVVEDAAEAHGALYRGRSVGGLGTAGCRSFVSNKIITTDLPRYNADRKSTRLNSSHGSNSYAVFCLK